MTRMTAAEYQKSIVGNVEAAENPYDNKMFILNVPKKMKMRNYTEIPGLPEVKERKHEEDDITISVTDYLEVLKVQGKVLIFSHIPQETFTKSWNIKIKNKKMGVRAGVPDMVIVYPSAVLFLELKRLKGGVVSDAQKEWISALQSVRTLNGSNIFAGVAYGFDDAKDQIDALLD